MVQIEAYGMKINIKIKTILQEIPYILKESVYMGEKIETIFISEYGLLVLHNKREKYLCLSSACYHLMCVCNKMMHVS